MHSDFVCNPQTTKSSSSTDRIAAMVGQQSKTQSQSIANTYEVRLARPDEL